jgi:dihydropteroate synthase
LSPGRAALGTVTVGDGLPVIAVGVVNLSPESFHAGSVYGRDDDLLGAALGMVEEGAALIDVGARSTAPYLDTEIDEAEERDRLGRAVELLARKLSVPISADTARAAPARAALEAGAAVINDVTGLRDPAVAELVREHGASVILMASPERGGPSPPGPPRDPVERVRRLLAAALERARAAGIPEERIVLDPGIGFFRDEGIPWHEWDARVLAKLGALTRLGRPICVGVSRKSFIGAMTGRHGPEARLPGSLAATALAVSHGASVIRTHDTAETLDAIRVAERVGRAGAS